MSIDASPLDQTLIPPAKQGDILPGVNRLFRERWSPRSFTDKQISDADLRLILEAGRWAASSSNEQPWRFVVARKSDSELFEKVFGVLDSYNQGWTHAASVLMLTFARTDFVQKQKPNPHARHDTGAALAYMLLQATALGLQGHGMAGFSTTKARAVFAIPPEYEPVAAAAFGYVGPAEVLSEPYLASELGARQRKPLSELIFHGEWDQPLSFLDPDDR